MLHTLELRDVSNWIEDEVALTDRERAFEYALAHDDLTREAAHIGIPDFRIRSLPTDVRTVSPA